jgi:putative ABC transport system ATP-binding protein
MPKAAFIDIRSLSKSFQEGEQKHHVLNGVNLAMQQGEFIALLGASGSGKSTLLNIISGIEVADKGKILFRKKNILDLDENSFTLFRRKHVGFIFQFFNLLPTLSTIENVMLPLEIAGHKANYAREKGMQLLAEVELADRGDSFPDNLSGGEQQRVAIARALVHDPSIILADEPTGNLDEESGAMVMNLLDRLTRAKGKNILMATHSFKNAEMADHIFQLKDGLLGDYKHKPDNK